MRLNRYATARIQFGKPIRDLSAVSRMMLSMRAEIEAGRALLFETGYWVDLLKAYEHLQSTGDDSIPDLRQKQKQISSYADILTPLTKFYNTEMGNRVCYQALQVHGGVGYMQEFNIERHYRDIRVTNIYEGTSQLQVVAALSKILGHALDPLLDEWASLEYGEQLHPLQKQLVESNQMFKIAIDNLKENEREIIDYYALDLANMACYLINSWLLLRDAREDERKRDLARLYIAEYLPEIHRAGEVIHSADATPLEVRQSVLS